MEWCSSIPKIELHAHLNGSIRDSTLLELARKLRDKEAVAFSDVEHVILKSDRALNEVFKLFELIHILATDHETITRITKEVIEDFAADNVIYLELRTTPKKNEHEQMSKRSYVEAVLRGIRSVESVEVELCTKQNADVSSHSYFLDGSCNGSRGRKIYVGLLLSIDRRENTDAALETVELALEMRNSGVVGIDLSGNPQIGKWSTFLPALEYAKREGLPITLHCGEVPNTDEIRSMLEFHPNRIGHACCFEENEYKILKHYKIPVEICLTSNINTKTISSIDVHHFADLYESKHPIILCTDDCGVFATSLSNEYALALSAFGLGEREMLELAEKGVDFVFSSDAVKAELKMMFSAAAKSLE
ncbi:hypothetical protein M569_13779, partial [Genlisea aurea]